MWGLFIMQSWPICKAGISLCNSGVPLTCDLALYYCQATQFAPIVAMSDNANIYDVRIAPGLFRGDALSVNFAVVALTL